MKKYFNIISLSSSSNLITLFSFLVLFCMPVLSQQEENKSKPLELPNFIIEGKEQLNIRSGIKQSPEIPDPMTAKELDSLNSLRKEQSLLLPPEQLPTSIISRNYMKGYLGADLGRFSVINAYGGYESNKDEYTFFGDAGYSHSSGHVKNSGYNIFKVNMATDYIAPEKFWIFGGSKTRSQIRFNNSNYNLYSNLDSLGNSPARDAMNLDLSIDSDGNYEGFQFSTGATLKTLQLYNKADKGFDNCLKGYLSVKNLWSQYEAGAAASVDIHGVHGSKAHFIQLNAFGTYAKDKYLLKLTAGFQLAQNSTGAEKGGLLLSANGEYRFDKLLTFKAQILSGLENNSYFELFRSNPYLKSNADIDYIYNALLMKGIAYYHPNESIGLSAGIEFGQQNNVPVYEDSSDGSFAVCYSKINKIEISFEGFWLITHEDELTARFGLSYSSLSENSKLLPYHAPLSLSVIYKRTWFDNIGTKIGLNFIGSRYTDKLNTEAKKLNSTADLIIGADYSFNNNFRAYFDATNLLNSNIIVWRGYKEWGLFISLGLLYQF